MKKKNFLLSVLFTSFLVVGGVATFNGKFREKMFSKLLPTSAEEETYKVVLNKDNYATIAEVGTFNDTIDGDKIATRTTNLGNDINFQFCSGRGVTNNDGASTVHTKFCQMPGYQYGWVTNKDPLHGITKIKLNVEQSSAVFRFDMSNSHTLENYYYSATRPDYVTYRSINYTGSNSYEINFDGAFNYFRLQNLEGHLSLISLEVYYSCGSYQERGTLRTDTTSFDISPITVSLGGKITIDYKYVDPATDSDNGVSIFLGTDLTNCFGNYKIFNNHLEKTYSGVTFSNLTDGYNRLVVDVSKLDALRADCVAPTRITKVLFRWFEPNLGVYFDIKSEPATPKVRGTLYKSGASNISLGKTYSVNEGGTIIVDYKYKDAAVDADNGVSIFFGTDTTNRFGNYHLMHNQLQRTYSGISFTALEDGYNRLTVNVAQLTDVRSECVAPTSITELSFRWFEPTEGVYFDVNPQDKTVKTTEFQMDGSSFKIANFTDVHIDSSSLLGDSGTVGKTIKYAIENSRPDILLFSGDLVGSLSHLDFFLPYLDSYQIPYFFILGNHDQGFNFDTLAQKVNQSNYGYIDKGPEDLECNKGNYTIKIKNSSGDLVHGLIMMDTGNKHEIEDPSAIEYVTNPISGVSYGSYNGRKTYCDSGNWNGLRGNQIDWYADQVDELNCETTLVCHIPFLEFCKAFEQYQDAKNRNDSAALAASAPIGKCVMGEPICGSMENLGMFSRILAKGSTKNVICGHDHVNAYSLMYQGVRLTYSVKCGEGSYWKTDGTICGYTELTVDSTGHTTLDQIYYNPLIN